jgi:hypothetical protein
MTLEEMIAAARELVSAANHNNGDLACVQQGIGDACTMQEEERPLTRAEKAKGWARRPFYAYDHDRMCSACRAYWYLSMAELSLSDIHRFRERVTAEKGAQS